MAPPAYNENVERLRPIEYPHMENGTYLDHSGTTIYPKSAITSFAAKLIGTNGGGESCLLYGNPHSANSPAKRSGEVVDSVRLRTLEFLGADPEQFDLVFVANATAGIKLVAESFRDLGERTGGGWTGGEEDGEEEEEEEWDDDNEGGGREGENGGGSFWYGYHKDSHTSLVGVRELTAGEDWYTCFGSDEEVDRWIAAGNSPSSSHSHSRRHRGKSGPQHSRPRLGLLAYPGQSNMSGRRILPSPRTGSSNPKSKSKSWPASLRASPDPTRQNTYTLFDAAALAMTFPMREIFQRKKGEEDGAPDFTVLSLYKIFGFPDLGCVVVRRESGHVLALRRYFGGGTVSMVTALTDRNRRGGGGVGGRGGVKRCGGGQRDWHVSKALSSQGEKEGKYNLHDGLEDGTLPFHSILALGEAIGAFERLYGDMGVVSRHASFLVGRLYEGMVSMRHGNGRKVVKVYGSGRGGAGGEIEDEKRRRSRFENSWLQGSTVAFNVVNEDGSYVPYSEVERRANDAGIYIRSGGVCNPGGIFSALGYEPWMTERALSAGHHCGSDGISIINRLPTGIVRASLGAMSTKSDVDTFLRFLHSTFVSTVVAKEEEEALKRSTVVVGSECCHQDHHSSSSSNKNVQKMSSPSSSASFSSSTSPPITTGGSNTEEMGDDCCCGSSSSKTQAYTLKSPSNKSGRAHTMTTTTTTTEQPTGTTSTTVEAVPRSSSYRFAATAAVPSPDGLAPVNIGIPLRDVVGGV